MSTHKHCCQFERKKIAKKVRNKPYDQALVILFVILLISINLIH